MTGKRFKTAFILGAGLGTRLYPLTRHVPKPLLPIGGRPMVTYAMDHLLTVGIERFIINTHHCPEKYLEAFPDRVWRDAPILFRHEPTLLDTGGGLKNIEDLLGEDEAIICYNGDIVCSMPLKPLVEAHDKTADCEATLALRTQGPNLNVDIDRSGSICDMRHRLKKAGGRDMSFYRHLHGRSITYCRNRWSKDRIDRRDLPPEDRRGPGLGAGNYHRFRGMG